MGLIGLRTKSYYFWLLGLGQTQSEIYYFLIFWYTAEALLRNKYFSLLNIWNLDTLWWRNTKAVKSCQICSIYCSLIKLIRIMLFSLWKIMRSNQASILAKKLALLLETSYPNKFLEQKIDLFQKTYVFFKSNVSSQLYLFPFISPLLRNNI